MTKQELLTHRIDKLLKTAAQAKAKSENRSLSNYIRNLIAKDVQK